MDEHERECRARKLKILAFSTAIVGSIFFCYGVSSDNWSRALTILGIVYACLIVYTVFIWIQIRRGGKGAFFLGPVQHEQPKILWQPKEGKERESKRRVLKLFLAIVLFPAGFILIYLALSLGVSHLVSGLLLATGGVLSVFALALAWIQVRELSKVNKMQGQNQQHKIKWLFVCAIVLFSTLILLSIFTNFP